MTGERLISGEPSACRFSHFPPSRTQVAVSSIGSAVTPVASLRPCCARKVGIDDTLCPASRCRPVALWQRREAAFVIVVPRVHTCKQTGKNGSYVWARADDVTETAEIVKIAKASTRIQISLAHKRDRTAITLPPGSRCAVDRLAQFGAMERGSPGHDEQASRYRLRDCAPGTQRLAGIMNFRTKTWFYCTRHWWLKIDGSARRLQPEQAMRTETLHRHPERQADPHHPRLSFG